ncbi:MAG: nuclear transport factor 2 family protein [Flavobacterium sp.]|nr:nuclear transport factor 2 family protein [Flavobacterium sp.]
MANTTLASIMEKNLKHVWSERDSSIRLKVIESLYAGDSALFHIDHQVNGSMAINDSVSGLLQHMPKDFVFSLLKPVVINNDVGRLIWGVGPEGKTPVQTGMDIVVFENNKIKSLYVFLD